MQRWHLLRKIRSNQIEYLVAFRYPLKVWEPTQSVNHPSIVSMVTVVNREKL